MTQKPWLHVLTWQHVKEIEMPCWLVKTPTMPHDRFPWNNRYASRLCGIYKPAVQSISATQLDRDLSEHNLVGVPLHCLIAEGAHAYATPCLPLCLHPLPANPCLPLGLALCLPLRPTTPACLLCLTPCLPIIFFTRLKYPTLGS